DRDTKNLLAFHRRFLLPPSRAQQEDQRGNHQPSSGRERHGAELPTIDGHIRDRRKISPPYQEKIVIAEKAFVRLVSCPKCGKAEFVEVIGTAALHREVKHGAKRSIVLPLAAFNFIGFFERELEKRQPLVGIRGGIDFFRKLHFSELRHVQPEVRQDLT